MATSHKTTHSAPATTNQITKQTTNYWSLPIRCQQGPKRRRQLSPAHHKSGPQARPRCLGRGGSLHVRAMFHTAACDTALDVWEEDVLDKECPSPAPPPGSGLRGTRKQPPIGSSHITNQPSSRPTKQPNVSFDLRVKLKLCARSGSRGLGFACSWPATARPQSGRRTCRCEAMGDEVEQNQG